MLPYRVYAMAPYSTLDLSIGSEVIFAGDHWRIQAHPSLTTVLLRKTAADEQVVACINDLTPVELDCEPPAVRASDIVHLSASAWEEAQRREAVIAPLASKPVVPASLAQEAADVLGLSRRTIYTLTERYRASGGMLSALAKQPPHGGRGKGRLATSVEGIIAITIDELYLSAQRYRPAVVIQEVRRRCHTAGLSAPSAKAIRSRLGALQPTECLRRRHGPKAAQLLLPVQGAFPPVARPLEVVQMDRGRCGVTG